MADRLGVGLVGSGFMANFHVRSWTSVRHGDIMGIANPDVKSAEAMARTVRHLRVGEPKVYADVREMVMDPKIDAIWICTPNYTRVEIMEQIAEVIKDGKGSLKGIAVEKPLARTVGEAKRMLEIVEQLGILHGYLENQVFAPSVVRGKHIVWARGAKVTGRPYLARCAEEHGGPHEPWFWAGNQQGGGVLNDMMCHSVEAARFLLSDPEQPKDALRPVSINAEIATLKWSRPEYIELLKEMTQGQVDYSKTPAEDFARANINFQDEKGNLMVAEVTTSWSFVGPGLRLSFELMGPEYYMQSNSLEPDLNVFFSRNVQGKQGEDLVEKQAAEQGLMPVLPNEELVYGYIDEDKYMVDCFLEGKMPKETLHDGLLVVQMLMSAYKSSELGQKLAFDGESLDDFVPKVAQGTYTAQDPINTAHK
jgi:predicted dehydrogenase